MPLFKIKKITTILFGKLLSFIEIWLLTEKILNVKKFCSFSFLIKLLQLDCLWNQIKTLNN